MLKQAMTAALQGLDDPHAPCVRHVGWSADLPALLQTGAEACGMSLVWLDADGAIPDRAALYTQLASRLGFDWGTAPNWDNLKDYLGDRGYWNAPLRLKLRGYVLMIAHPLLAAGHPGERELFLDILASTARFSWRLFGHVIKAVVVEHP